MIFRRILPAAVCCALLLGGCGKAPAETPLPTGTDGGNVTESPAPNPTQNIIGIIGMGNTGTPAPAAPEEGAGMTEDKVRAMYENEPFIVEKVTPYNGDYLVQYGAYGEWQFDWVYGKTGERHRIMYSNYGVREVEILETGKIRVLTEGVCSANGYRSFPEIQTGYAAVQLDENGKPLPYKIQTGNFSTETYWADINEACSFGLRGRKEAVVNAVISASGFEMAFGPRAGEDFVAAFCAPPGIDITFDETTRIMTITCRDTALKSGEQEFDDPLMERDFERFIEEWGTPFPSEFPSGALPGSNPLISSATINEDGKDTVVRLYLTEKAAEYTVESEYTGPDDKGPYIRVVLRERGRR